MSNSHRIPSSHVMSSYMSRSPTTETLRMTQHQQQYVNQHDLESPQHLHHPRPLVPAQPYSPRHPAAEEYDSTYSEQQPQQNYSTSAPVPSGMTLAAVAAAADSLYNQPSYAQDGHAEASGSPVVAEPEHPSPGTKRLFIHPFPYGQVPPPPSTAPASTSDTSAQSASSSAGTFSTHNPPTPGSAPSSAPDFAAACKTTLAATGAGAYSSYAPPPPTQERHHEDFGQPPQTAPLLYRSSSFEGAAIPPTPASAHTNLHYAQCHPSSALAAAAEHHSSYPGPSLAAVNGIQPQLPAPGAYSYSSAFPASPFNSRTFPAVHGSDYTGYAHPLPPLRSVSSRASVASPILDSPHHIVSPLPSHMQHPGYPGHAMPYGPGMTPPLKRPMNLDEEVKNIEAHSGATSFISKLWFLLSQPQEFGEYIRWTVKGKGFILSHNSPTFGEAILSRFFRHSNIASFVRQLNLYKMQRMSQLALLEDLNDSGGRVDGELTHTGFSHPHLQRGHPEMLHMIKPQSGRKRTKKEMSASAALDELSPASSPGRKTRTASSASVASGYSR